MFGWFIELQALTQLPRNPVISFWMSGIAVAVRAITGTSHVCTMSGMSPNAGLRAEVKIILRLLSRLDFDIPECLP